MAETITAKITKVNKNGFQVEGWQNWFNLSKGYEDSITIPGVGAEVEFTYSPWKHPETGKTTFYTDNLVAVTQVAVPEPAPAKSYDGMQPVPVSDRGVTTTAPDEAPRIEPEPVPETAGPVLGTHAYTSLSIERQVALKAAVETLNHCEGEYKSLVDAQSAVLFLASMYNAFLRSEKTAEEVAEPAPPDDLVPLPSEMTAPPPEYQGD